MTSCPVCGHTGVDAAPCNSPLCRGNQERPDPTGIPVASSEAPFPAMKPDSRPLWANYHHDFGDV